MSTGRVVDLTEAATEPVKRLEAVIAERDEALAQLAELKAEVRQLLALLLAGTGSDGLAAAAAAAEIADQTRWPRINAALNEEAG